jgi:hypothetical protein
MNNLPINCPRCHSSWYYGKPIFAWYECPSRCGMEVYTFDNELRLYIGEYRIRWIHGYSRIDHVDNALSTDIKTPALPFDITSERIERLLLLA